MDELKFQLALREIFKSNTGTEVLKYLESVYVDPIAVRSTVEGTFYALGQKELIQGLIKDALNTDNLTEFTTTTEDL